MDILINILCLLLMLTLIVCIHELGHLITAKIFGVYCQEYAIGMGPAIFKHQFKETLFSIRAFPFGGFVKLAGEPDDGLESKSLNLDLPKERTLTGVARWKQIIIYLAGVIMNIVLAFAVMLVAYSNYRIVSSDVISTINPDIRVGDHIVSVNGQTLIADYDLEQIAKQGIEADFVIERDGEEITLTLEPMETEAGYTFGTTLNSRKLTFLEIVEAAWGFTIEMMTLISTALKQLFTKEGITNVGGLISMYQMVSTNELLVERLALTAMLSVNVGIINALPIPVMDGGRVFITLIEMVRRKPLSTKAMNFAFAAGFLLVLMIFAWSTGLDFARLFGLI